VLSLRENGRHGEAKTRLKPRKNRRAPGVSPSALADLNCKL
jgi:hypothetical protein